MLVAVASYLCYVVGKVPGSRVCKFETALSLAWRMPTRCCCQGIFFQHQGLPLQGIAGHGYYDNCTVPIIENTARECELTDRLRQAIKDYPKSQAVLVRRHGVYVWGSTWIQAKTQAECYDYLFEAALKMKAVVGINASQPATRALAVAANGVAQNGHASGTPSFTRAPNRWAFCIAGT